MLSLVADWKASGLSQKAFSALHGIKLYTFIYWVARSKESGNSGKFIPLSPTVSGSGNLIEIIYPTGVRLKVEGDLSLISQLIRL